MKALAIAFLVGCLAGGGATYGAFRKEAAVAESQREELLGYRKYSDYLSVGKQSLLEQTKFLAATVRRNETLTREIHRKVGVFRSDATVAISYVGEYSFGYDLQPNSYEIRDSATGIELVLSAKPTLVASPAIKSKTHTIPSSGWLIDERAAIIETYEGMDGLVEAKGRAMAAEEAIVALCEKKIIAFLADFLSRQPGVRRVPNITVAYRT